MALAILHIMTIIILIVALTSAGYVAKGWFAWYYHDKLNWHIPRETSLITDGVNNYGICKYCDKVIQQDNQGKWIC